MTFELLWNQKVIEQEWFLFSFFSQQCNIVFLFFKWALEHSWENRLHIKYIGVNCDGYPCPTRRGSHFFAWNGNEIERPRSVIQLKDTLTQILLHSLLIKWIFSNIVIGFLQAELWLWDMLRWQVFWKGNTPYFFIHASPLHNERESWGWDKASLSLWK